MGSTALPVSPAVQAFQDSIRQHWCLLLNKSKTEVFAWRELPAWTPPGLKKAGISSDNGKFHSGFECVGLAINTEPYIKQ